MNRKLLDKLCCPFDKKDLNLEVFQETEDQQIIEGILTCTSCNRYFPIIYGIPIMTPDEYREKSLELPSLKRWGLEMAAGQQSFQLAAPENFKKLE
ncbi:Trm112 family protein [Algoriphagus vanfongensis]|uniref:Trm112 family protein n=1 Tax=Algoriphagus vanfongensis TaxID=426371 RepID=UPI0004042627|nr:Trm112 family protein [Algoriphagus vanfongensis]